MLIEVLPINDNPPFFLEDNFTVIVRENLNFSHLIRASDLDNDTLKYSFTQPIPPFNIDSRSGIIRSDRVLDFEQSNSYILPIEVTDGLFTTKTQLFVDLLDENDNVPMFVQNYSFVVDENLIAGTELVQVLAEDRDSSSNGLINYQFKNPTTSINFKIDRDNGSITLQRLLDFEVDKGFAFTVLAVDQGSPKLTGESTVVITVLDLDDNPPRVTSSINMFVYLEGSAELLLGSNIILIDDDTYPISGAMIILSVPICVISIEELNTMCSISDKLCVEQCRERVEVGSLCIFCCSMYIEQLYIYKYILTMKTINVYIYTCTMYVCIYVRTRATAKSNSPIFTKFRRYFTM